MAFKDESIIGRVEDLTFSGIWAGSQWDVVFTNKGLIFVMMGNENWIITFGAFLIVVGMFVDFKALSFALITLGVVILAVGSEVVFPKLVKKKRLEMKDMNISEMLADDKDNFKLTREELKNIEVKRGNALVKSRLFIKKDGKKMRMSFNKKEDIDIFLSLLERIKAI